MKQFVTNHFERFVNQKIPRSLFTASVRTFVDHDEPTGVGIGPDAAKAMMEAAYAKWPDLHVTIEDLRTMDHEANANTVTIPTNASRNGDLSGAPSVIYDPATGNPDGTGRQPFPNNQIPLSRINPVAMNLLALVPAPNQNLSQVAPSNNYFGLLPFQKTTDSLDCKMDYNISANDRLSGRFSFSRPVSFQAPIFGNGGGPAQGAFEGTAIQKTYSSGINYNRIFSSTFLAEFRFGVAHFHNDARQADYGINDDTKVGSPGVNTSAQSSGITTINVGNFGDALGPRRSKYRFRRQLDQGSGKSYDQIRN